MEIDITAATAKDSLKALADQILKEDTFTEIKNINNSKIEVLRDDGTGLVLHHSFANKKYFLATFKPRRDSRERIDAIYELSCEGKLVPVMRIGINHEPREAALATIKELLPKGELYEQEIVKRMRKEKESQQCLEILKDGLDNTYQVSDRSFRLRMNNASVYVSLDENGQCAIDVRKMDAAKANKVLRILSDLSKEFDK